MLYHRVNWKNSVALQISIDAGSFDEPKGYEGYTHIAEHLMFSGTRKFSRKILREKMNRMFDRFDLEATTSRESISIFSCFDKKYFDEAVETLEQMIFSWRCTEERFIDEKKMLVDEVQEYYNSYEYQWSKAANRLLPIPQSEVLGSIHRIKRLSFPDIKKITPYWQNIVKIKSRRVTVLGNLTDLQLDQLVGKFEYNSHPGTESREFQVVKKDHATEYNVAAYWFQSNRPHALTLLLDRVYYWRWRDNPRLYFDYKSKKIHDVTAFTVFCERFEGIGSKKAVEDFFRRAPSRQEFDRVKEIFLSSFRIMLDGLDPIESLHFLDGFASNHYAPLRSTKPRDAYNYFNTMTFEEFSLFCREILY